jgi:hypothetical protein
VYQKHGAYNHGNENPQKKTINEKKKKTPTKTPKNIPPIRPDYVGGE